MWSEAIADQGTSHPESKEPRWLALPRPWTSDVPHQWWGLTCEKPGCWFNGRTGALQASDRGSIPRRSTMKKGILSKEVLHHFQCGICQKWWTVGDAPAERLEWFCSWCGSKQEFTQKSSGL